MRRQLELDHGPTYRPQSIRVIVIDEKEIMRVGLRTILEQDSDFRVVGEAPTMNEFRPWASRPGFEIVIWGISPRTSDFLKNYPELSKQFPKTKVMALACQIDEQTIHTISQAPGISCVLKEVKPGELILRLRQLAQDTNFVDPNLSTFFFEKIKSFTNSEYQGDYPPLSKREQKVVAMIAKGRTNKEIASTMKLTEKTIKNYVSNIFDKLHVTRRTQIAAIFSTWEKQQSLTMFRD